MFDRMKVVTRMAIGFALMLIGALTLGFVAARSVSEMSLITTQIFRHPFAVSTAIHKARADILSAQRISGNLIARQGSEGEAQKLEQVMSRIDNSMATVRERHLGNPAEIAQLDQALGEWNLTRHEVLGLARSGRLAEAQALHDGRSTQLMEQLLKEVGKVAAASSNKAAELRDEAASEKMEATGMVAVLLALIISGGTLVAFMVTQSVKHSLVMAAGAIQHVIDNSEKKVHAAEAIGRGDLEREIVAAEPLKLDVGHLSGDEMGDLMRAAVRLSEMQEALDEAFRSMQQSLLHAQRSEQERDWLKSGGNILSSLMREDQTTATMADSALTFLVEYLGAGVGALYLYDDEHAVLRLTSTYAFSKDLRPAEELRLGEGLIGQAARETRVVNLTNVPTGYMPIGSALGAATPTAITAIPLLHGIRLVGMIEIGAFREFTEIESSFIDQAREAIAVGLDVNLARQRTAELLEQTQQQAEELRVQQEELQQSNEELEERAEMLEQQREAIRTKNREIEAASETLRQKATELERVSTYKSEFLANMSHELRTPLNSLMILSSLLKENKEGTLSAKQVEYATTINNAGRDLLELINDILDLSKVEAGQMEFHIVPLPPGDICESLRSLFEPIADNKGLPLRIDIAADAPSQFHGDEQRVHQILKNLLSNAFKFTERGEVALSVAAAGADNPLGVPAIAFAVSDTGIGIPADKQQLVFEAFHQADGSISRKYGGTGLGLSISRHLASKMHGDIRMHSEEGKGSCFTLFMPLAAAAGTSMPTAAPAPVAKPLPRPAPAAERPAAAPPARAIAEIHPAPLPDDRERLVPGEKCILIVEDDLNFARILQDTIRERGFATLMAADGESGIAMADRYTPSAIVLDVMLPHIDGWGVMRSLKDNPRTRHIPVHFITCMEERQKALAMGAIGFATKPVSIEQLSEVFRAIEASLAKSMRKLLIVEDNADEARSMVALLEDEGVEIVVAGSGRTAIELLASQAFDCMVLDLGLADMSGFELLEFMQGLEGARRIPVIVHSGRDLSHEDERRLRRYAESIIIKGAMSPERLLNEVTLFLHLVESNLHPNKQRMIRTAIDKEAQLEGRKVLLVDDDMRNIFSLSSVLMEKNMVVIEAENGREALARLAEHDDIGIVLMDVMMPEMDGYAAMREIRRNPRLAHLPVIAMTAKALRGDQEKCLEAGASDYIAKPIDVDKLLSLIRVWIFQHG